MDEKAKKTLLRQISYGLYVVTLRRGDEIGGFSATWMTQCSFSPPMIAMAVKADSRARELVEEGSPVAVHFLKKDQKGLAKLFFQAPPAANGKFGDFAFGEGLDGVPVLEGVLGVLEGKVRTIVPEGDHHVVLVEVTGAAINGEGDCLALADTDWKYGG